MISGFGVDHGSVSKAEKPTDSVDDVLTPVLPGSTVRAYDNSRKNKRKAGAQNYAVKTAGALAGGTAGTILALKTKGRIKYLNKATMVRKVPITPQHKQGYYASTIGGAGGSIGGGAAGNASLYSIKKDPEYKYKER